MPTYHPAYLLRNPGQKAGLGRYADDHENIVRFNMFKKRFVIILLILSA